MISQIHLQFGTSKELQQLWDIRIVPCSSVLNSKNNQSFHGSSPVVHSTVLQDNLNIKDESKERYYLDNIIEEDENRKSNTSIDEEYFHSKPSINNNPIKSNIIIPIYYMRHGKSVENEFSCHWIQLPSVNQFKTLMNRQSIDTLIGCKFIYDAALSYTGWQQVYDFYVWCLQDNKGMSEKGIIAKQICNGNYQAYYFVSPLCRAINTLLYGLPKKPLKARVLNCLMEFGGKLGKYGIASKLNKNAVGRGLNINDAKREKELWVRHLSWDKNIGMKYDDPEQKLRDYAIQCAAKSVPNIHGFAVTPIFTCGHSLFLMRFLQQFGYGQDTLNLKKDKIKNTGLIYFELECIKKGERFDFQVNLAKNEILYLGKMD